MISSYKGRPTMAAISNSPQPCSVSSNGGVDSSRIGVAKLG